MRSKYEVSGYFRQYIADYRLTSVTYAPTPAVSSFKILVAVVDSDWEMQHLDVNQAFFRLIWTWIFARNFLVAMEMS